jgi:hypothetical protein
MSQLSTEILIKPNRMRWVRHAALMLMRNSQKISIGKSQGANASEIMTSIKGKY